MVTLTDCPLGAASGRATCGSFFAAAAVLMFLGCAGGQEQAATAGGQAAADSIPLNTLTDAEREAGWTLLFDGHSLDGWRGYNRDDALEGWAAQDGSLARVSAGGDLITEGEFGDFELSLEWRVGEAGNSGVFYRAAVGEEWIYHSAPEMQVLDDAGHRDGQNPLTRAGSNYGLHASLPDVVHPAGEWNLARIVVDGDRVEHWLNGKKVVEYDLGSAEWEALVAKSKFVEWPAYGRASRGHIGLQDHGDPVWYRNMKVREIR